MESPSETLGERLGTQGPHLQLLLAHLAGRAILARVDVEDLVQEVFLRALSTTSEVPPTEPGEASLRRFLGRIGRNVVVDVARALRTRKRDGSVVALVRSDWSRAGVRESQVGAGAAGPSTVAVGREAERRLLEAWRGLSPDHRRVLGLRQFEGLSAAATARRMGRSEDAVHSLYRRALLAWEEAGA